jgi:hypothetical protein
MLRTHYSLGSHFWSPSVWPIANHSVNSDSSVTLRLSSQLLDNIQLFPLDVRDIYTLIGKTLSLQEGREAFQHRRFVYH